MTFARFLPVLALFLSLSGCAGQPESGGAPPDQAFQVSDLVKSDIHLVVESHRQEVMEQLRLLMARLYLRNPAQLRRGGASSSLAVEKRIFSTHHDWQFPEFQGKMGGDCVELAFQPEFQGDRVLAFVAGLGYMIFASYDQQREFHLFDQLDPQKLHNSARNIELAAWKLSHLTDARQRPFLLSLETNKEEVNLGYERLLGKMIALQDVMAQVAAGRNRRLVKQTLTFVASAVFLPI